MAKTGKLYPEVKQVLQRLGLTYPERVIKSGNWVTCLWDDATDFDHKIYGIRSGSCYAALNLAPAEIRDKRKARHLRELKADLKRLSENLAIPLRLNKHGQLCVGVSTEVEK